MKKHFNTFSVEELKSFALENGFEEKMTFDSPIVYVFSGKNIKLVYEFIQNRDKRTEKQFPIKPYVRIHIIYLDKLDGPYSGRWNSKNVYNVVSKDRLIKILSNKYGIPCKSF